MVSSIKDGKIDDAKNQAENDSLISEPHRQKVMVLDSSNYINAKSFDTIEAVEGKDNIVRCNRCSRKMLRSKLQEHILACHAYICPTMKENGKLCNQRFASKQELDNHLKTCER